MTRWLKPTPKVHQAVRGFTLLEVIFVVVIIALLAAVALPIYQSYRARSQASELALKYDAIRTNIQVAAKTGEFQSACAALASTVQAANLHSDYAQLAVDFEPVTGGYTPVLTMCSSRTNQGPHGVEVTREAHSLLGRNSAISPGAVIGDSAVSFSVKLAGDTALCKLLPPVANAKAACGSATVTSGPANIPVPVTSGPVGPASTPSVPASTPVATPQSVAASATCPRSPSGPVSRQAMRFDGNSRVASSQNLNTRGDLTEFTAEVVVTGDASGRSSAALLSYSSGRPYSGFSIWAPNALYLEIGSMNYPTDINIADGRPHRLTVTWQQSGGTLVLYDNGREVWRIGGVNSGGTVDGNGRLTIGQVDRPREVGGA